jgi:hypothetical protein
MKKSKKTPDLVSVSWLAEEHHHDRATISRRLQGVPFVIGKKGAKLYDREVAATAIESRDHDLATLVHERARKAQIERQLRQLQLDELQKTMLPTDLMTDTIAALAVELRGEIESWPCTEACKMRCYLSLEQASITVAKLLGADTRRSEQDLSNRRKKLAADVAAGRIPDHWFDAHMPENSRRVWSLELGRYYTKKEIIAKFGPGAQISPIDEILAEAASLEQG